MSEIRYLMDENVDPILRSALLRTEPNLTVGQIGGTGFPNFGTLDPAILIWCEENRFILVTKNRHSMPGHLAEHLAGGRHAMAVFILNADLTMRETLDDYCLSPLHPRQRNIRIGSSISRQLDLGTGTHEK